MYKRLCCHLLIERKRLRLCQYDSLRGLISVEIKLMDLFADIEDPPLPFLFAQGIDWSCHWDEAQKVYFVTIPNGELVFARGFFSKKLSDRSLAYFQENDCLDWKNTDWCSVSAEALAKLTFTHINWQQDQINMFGKIVPLPRLTAWYGDPSKAYTYSGITSHPNQWNEGLRYIKQAVEALAQESFNSVLLNWYRNGADHMGWHADDEKELGKNPTIASVSFGEPRDFILRSKDDPSKKITIPLEHGTVLIMRGALQHFWQHSVPKRTRLENSRFNLTFRHIF